MEAPRSTEPTSSDGWDQLLDGRYRAAEEIGRGSMGVVYVAEHTRLSKRVAIKVLHPDLAEDDEACERFELEARAASRVGSPHIVDVIDAGALEDGRRFLVMEYLRGETFKAWLEEMAPLTPERLAPFVLQLCEGLAAAHDQGIVHRDVKPDNLFLVKRRKAEPLLKILDFGVSKFRDHGTDALRSRTGIVLGTPHYMAPEQARGEREVDRRADLYSVGIVMYQALSGERPFSADNVNQLLFRVALEDVPRIDSVVPSVPAAFADIVAKATARDPDQRYGSARLLARDVQQWLDGEQPASASGPTTAIALAVDVDAPMEEGGEPGVTIKSPEAKAPEAPEKAVPASSHLRWWALGVAALVLGTAAVVRQVVVPTDSSAAARSAAGEAPPVPSSSVGTLAEPEPVYIEPKVSQKAEPTPTANAETAESAEPIAPKPTQPSMASPNVAAPHAKPPPADKTPRPFREDL